MSQPSDLSIQAIERDWVSRRRELFPAIMAIMLSFLISGVASSFSVRDLRGFVEGVAGPAFSRTRVHCLVRLLFTDSFFTHGILLFEFFFFVFLLHSEREWFRVSLAGRNHPESGDVLNLCVLKVCSWGLVLQVVATVLACVADCWMLDVRWWPMRAFAVWTGVGHFTVSIVPNFLRPLFRNNVDISVRFVAIWSFILAMRLSMVALFPILLSLIIRKLRHVLHWGICLIGGALVIPAFGSVFLGDPLCLFAEGIGWPWVLLLSWYLFCALFVYTTVRQIYIPGRKSETVASS